MTTTEHDIHRIVKRARKERSVELIRGTVESYVPGDHSTLVTIGKGANSVPVEVPALPVIPVRGDQVEILRTEDGRLVVVHVLDRAPVETESPWVTLRASGGDDTYALQERLAEPGLRTWLPDTLYTVTSELVWSKHNVHLKGSGAARKTMDGTPVDGTTTIVRNGTSLGVIRVDAGGDYTAYGNEPPMMGGSLEGINIRGTGTLEYGLRFQAGQAFTIRNVTVLTGSAIGVKVDSHTASSVLPNERDRCVRLMAYDLHIGTGSGVGLHISSGWGQHYYALEINGGSGVGLVVDGAWDDINFYGGSITSGSGTYTFDIGANSRGWGYGMNFFGGYPMYSAAGIVRSNALAINFYGLGTIDDTDRVIVEAGADVHLIRDDGRSTIVPDPRSFFLVKDDFVGAGNAGELAWDILAASPTLTDEPPTANRKGIKSLTTTATSGTLAGCALSATVGIFVPSVNWSLVWNASLSAAIDANVMTRFGVCGGGQHGTDPPGDGVWVEKAVGDTTWFYVCRIAGVQTRTDSTSTVTNGGWLRIKMHRVSATAIGFRRFDFLTNQADHATIATNVPTVNLVPFAQVRNGEAVAKKLLLDLMMLSIDGLDR